MKSIVLIGYMGAGKTTVGKALAAKANLGFYDLDWYIEDRYHTRISTIFQQKGEDGFRRLEQLMLHEVTYFEDCIIATGGGTPCFFNNMEFMNQNATTIYLKASPSTIIQHLKLSHTVRPLLQNKQGDELLGYIQNQLAERSGFYNMAHHCVDVNILDSYQKIDLVVNQILNLIK